MFGVPLSVEVVDAIESGDLGRIGDVKMSDFYVYCLLNGIEVRHRTKALLRPHLAETPIVKRERSRSSL